MNQQVPDIADSKRIIDLGVETPQCDVTRLMPAQAGSLSADPGRGSPEESPRPEADASHKESVQSAVSVAPDMNDPVNRLTVAVPCSPERSVQNSASSNQELPELVTADITGRADYLGSMQPCSFMPENPAMPNRIGRFEIQQVLGIGGFGIVYKAFDPVIRRDIALKVPGLRSLANKKMMALFEREARVAGSLDHPNIVPIYETGKVGTVCYIAQAYCAGPNLGEWLRRQVTPIPFNLIAALISKLAGAVHYSHSKGVLHRDLKPSNVLLVPDGEGPSEPGVAVLPFVPRLTDFGIAKIFGDDFNECPTETATVIVGTLPYMAPEQTGDSEFVGGPEIDVYGLGAILYEMLTGRQTFQVAGVANLVDQVRNCEPVAPRILRHEIPPDLETICLRCLEKKPANRFQTAQDLKADLDRYLRGEPILSRPDWLIRSIPAVVSAAACHGSIDWGVRPGRAHDQWTAGFSEPCSHEKEPRNHQAQQFRFPERRKIASDADRR